MSRPLAAALAVCVLAPAVALPSASRAADRMFSYEPASPEAKRLTGRGLTFIFQQSMVRTRAKRMMATAVSAQAWLKPVGEGVLGKGGRGGLVDAKSGADPILGELYEIRTDTGQGKVFVRAWCPGSTQLWVAIPRFAYSQALPVTAIGDDPADKTKARVCSRMEFAFKGEWKVPGHGIPDPMEDALDGGGLEGAGF